jgi:CRISPR-associated protein Csx10
MSLFLEIKLLGDVAISERSATVGGHRALLYLPGSQLLGAAAKALYDDSLDPKVAWSVFHAGEVRFGNAYLFGSGDAPALPLPLSLYAPKGAPAKDRLSGVLTEHVVNRARGQDEPRVQFSQIRSEFIDGRLAVRSPRLRTSLRTAVDPTGRAQDGLLFGITAMQAGTVLRGRIDADSPALLDQVGAALAGKTLRIGRSKHAEFGLVEVRKVDPWGPPPRNLSPEDDTAVFWCLSDLALRHQDTGQVTLAPLAEWFGLPPGWAFDARRSFLRTRRYSPFNTHRERPDLERQVIVAGSVLCFAGTGRPDPDAIDRVIARGIGEHRAEGLGQVAYEPALLAQRRIPPPASAAPALRAAEAAKPAAPTGALFKWVEERERRRAARDEAWEVAMEWVAKLAKPSWSRLPAAQWGEIRVRARRHAHEPARLVAEIESYTGDSLRKLEKRWGAQHEGQTLGKQLVELLRDLLRHDDRKTLVGPALELLAVHLSRRLEEGRR